MGGAHSKETLNYFVEYGAASYQGRRLAQEDRFEVDLQYGSDQAKSFFGVYDGHFGTKAAEFCRDNLAKEIITNAEFDQQPLQAIKSSIVAVDQALLEKCQRKGDKSGTTALAVILINRAMLVAHVGNCRLLVQHNDQMLQLTKDHKPTNKTERRRIRRLGGCIVNHRLQGRMAVSRAIGDLPYKNINDLENSLLTSEPDVFVTKLDPSVEYLLLATDGLLQRLSQDEVADFIAQRKKAGMSFQAIAEALTTKAIEVGSDDNVTVILVGFRHKVVSDEKGYDTASVFSEEVLRRHVSAVSHYAYDDPDGESSKTADSVTSISDESLIPPLFRVEPTMD